MSALHAGRQWTEEELDAEFGAPAEVLVLPTGTSTLNENPRPRPCPCNTEDQEPEVRWLLRQHREGHQDPVAIVLPGLAGASKTGRLVAEFFALVYGLRLSVDDARPVPLSARFVGEHTGLHWVTANRALNGLCEAKVLRHCDPLPPRGGRGAADKRRGWTRHNPVEGVDLPRAPVYSEIRYLTTDEAWALIDAARPGDFQAIDRAMYLTAAMTGLRIGELQALDWRSVDFVHARIRVRRTWDRKAKVFTAPKSRRSERAVPMADEVAGRA
jgi:hypothetical protein